MELMVIVLNKEEHLATILSILTELDISDSIIVNSEKLEHFLAYEVPIFAALRQMTEGARSACKTILTLINEKDFIPKFNKLLAEENIDFTRPDVGALITLPVNKVIKSSDETL